MCGPQGEFISTSSLEGCLASKRGTGENVALLTHLD